MKKPTKWEQNLNAMIAKKAQKTTTVKVRTRDVTVKTSVRVPRAVWDQVRLLAIRRHVTAQELIQEAIENLLKGERK